MIGIKTILQARRRTKTLFPTAIFFSVSCVGCGGVPQNNCDITAVVAPLSAISDHLAAPPDDQVQFAAVSSVSGDCPLTPDTVGTWSTSAPGNTSIDSNGLATCLGATTTPATIRNSGKARGTVSFSPATLTCR